MAPLSNRTQAAPMGAESAGEQTRAGAGARTREGARHRAASAPLPLLRRLRAEFIAVNMALAALVLAGSFAAICYTDYRSETDEVYRTLNAAVNRAVERPQLVPQQDPLEPFIMLGDGAEAPVLPHSQPYGQNTASSGAAEAGQETQQDGESDAYAPFQIGGAGSPEGSIPVAVYSCEYGEIYQLNQHSSAAVPDTLLGSAVSQAQKAEDSDGYLDAEGLFFARKAVGAVTVVAFADSSAASAWKSLVLMLALVGVGALGVLLLLNVAFSRWALRPVQQAWTQQQQFIADASHELKTPLTVILANNAILRERGDETISSQRQWIDSTQTEAERMQGLVTDMLDLARSGAAAEDAPREPVDLSHLVQGEELTFEAVAFERGVQWKSFVAAGVTVRGDERRLQRLVAALLDNACKYTPAGGTVNVRLAADDRWAMLTVRNSGEPIALEDLEHLFDRFYRADKARTHNARQATAVQEANAAGGAETTGAEPASEPAAAPKAAAVPDATPAGYGLGLAIARGIAEAHKGTLTATSTPDEGTTFTLKLPLS